MWRIQRKELPYHRLARRRNFANFAVRKLWNLTKTVPFPLIRKREETEESKTKQRREIGRQQHLSHHRAQTHARSGGSGKRERKGRVGTVDFPCGESILLLLLLLRFCHLSAGDCTRCCCNSSNPSSRYGTFFSTASPLLLALMSFVLPPQTPTPSSIILLSFCLLPCVDLARRDG
jgi:hypothetical protein